jgi:hypothetical protein
MRRRLFLFRAGSVQCLPVTGRRVPASQARILRLPSGESTRVKDRWIAARTLYGKYVSADEPMTPAQIAEDHDLPVEIVLEAIRYCESNPPEIAEDFAREETLMRAAGEDEPGYPRRAQPKPLSAAELARLRRA